MIFKIITLFLAFMALIGMLGKWRTPSKKRPVKVKAKAKAKTLAKCPDCGRPRIGRGPCDCGKG